MNLPLVTSLYPVLLFAGMLALLETGRRIGLRRLARDMEGARAGLGAVEGAIFGLMGLLVAFTFSGASSRFEARRQLIVQEANSIGTAWVRLDLLPDASRIPLQEHFRAYLDARILAFDSLPEVPAAEAALSESDRQKDTIWRLTVAACRDLPAPTASLILPAINEMFDVATARWMALHTHPPKIVFVMLAFLALASSLLAGFGMAGSRKRSWIHLLGFSAIMAVTVFVILDLEYPRRGVIRIDAADQLLEDLRRSMH